MAESQQTAAQLVAVLDCMEMLIAQGKKPTWHPNECGCCVSVHEDVPHPDCGYLIGSDGDATWMEVPHGAT